MALNKSFGNVVSQKNDSKGETTRLTVLDRNDKNTIFNLIIKETNTQGKTENK